MNEWDRLRQQAKRIKEMYPKGTKVRLTYMEGEPNLPVGLQGKVSCVDDIGQIHVNWENGSSLALNANVDSFQVVSRPEKKKNDPCR